MRIFLILLLSSVASADYKPYVQIINAVPQREYSGVVFSEDETRYYVLTCAHGVQDLKSADIVITTNTYPDPPTSIKYIGVVTTLIKFDADMDISVMSMPKVPEVTIRPLKLAEGSLPYGTECNSYGYINGAFVKNPVTYGKIMEFTSLKGSPILECMGEAKSGMSGGPLVFQGKIWGIQSSGNKKHILYCPSGEILGFVDRIN